MTELELPQPFTALPHTADAGVVVTGKTPEETLARLVLAYAQLCTAGRPVEVEGKLTLEVAGGTDLSTIAIDALRAVHSILTQQKRVPGAVAVDGMSRDGGVKLVLALGRWDPARYPEGLDVKAVTYHAAAFEEADGGWRAQAVFDL